MRLYQFTTQYNKSVHFVGFILKFIITKNLISTLKVKHRDICSTETHTASNSGVFTKIYSIF